MKSQQFAHRATGPRRPQFPSLRRSLIFLTVLAVANASYDRANGDETTADKPAPLRRGAVPLGVSCDILDRDVQDRLMLSDEQRQKISTIEEQRQSEEQELDTANGTRSLSWKERQKLKASFLERVESVLTREQRVAWSRLSRLWSAALFGPYQRIDEEEARDELRLRVAQAKAVSDLQQEFCRACERISAKYDDPDATRDLPYAERPLYSWGKLFAVDVNKAAEDFEARFDKLVGSVFDETQKERWYQLEWQKAADKRGVEPTC